MAHPSMPLTMLHRERWKHGEQEVSHGRVAMNSGSTSSKGHVLHNCSLSLPGDSSDKSNRNNYLEVVFLSF